MHPQTAPAPQVHASIQASGHRALAAVDETATMKKVLQHIVPFVFICYVVSYLDRVNVGFAALTMNRELGLTPSQFGLGAGLFFLGYFIFEIPSNLALHKYGARVWIARIMISWGLISMATAFVVGPKSFALSRFLLGLAEAGFTPGIYLYFTTWFPGAWRGRATAAFLVGIPVANVVGSPVSGLLMASHGVAGLHGWQMLLLVEALPAVVLGLLCLYLLPDRPSQARWLTPDEQAWLDEKLASEQKILSEKYGDKLRDALTNWRVFALAFINLCGIIGSLGIGLWLPQIVREFGLPSEQVGLVTAIPYAAGAASMLLWSRRANQSPRRLRYVVTAMLVAAAALAVSAFLTTPTLKLLAITLTVSAILSFQATFWAIPSGFLTGRAAAGGLALIVSIGNLGGFIGPSMIGFIKEATKGFTLPLLAVAGALLVGAAVMLLLGDPAKANRSI